MPAKKGSEKATGGSGKLTKEEERLLLVSSRHVTRTTSALFYGNGFIVSALPLWLYWRVQMMELLTYAIVFAALTILSTWMVAYAYKNTKISLKHKISLKREGAVSKEVLSELSSSAGTKKLSKAEKDERISWKKNEVADGEATTFSIFYINTLYLFLVLMFYYFSIGFHPAINYATSTIVPGVLLALLSTA